MRASHQAIDLIKRFEGFSATPYRCPAGKLTIGYGHVITMREEYTYPPLAEEDAKRILAADLTATEGSITKAVQVPLSQGQFDALCSLVYNWGAGNFLRSGGLKYLNNLNYTNAALEFFSRDKGVVKIAGKFSQGLYNRRLAELELWNAKV
jgi:lysozyme